MRKRQPNLKRMKDLNRHFTKESIQTTNMHMKGHLLSWSSWMQVKTAMGYQYTSTETANIFKNLMIPSFGGVLEQLESSYWWKCKLAQHCWKHVCLELLKLNIRIPCNPAVQCLGTKPTVTGASVHWKMWPGFMILLLFQHSGGWMWRGSLTSSSAPHCAQKW